MAGEVRNVTSAAGPGRHLFRTDVRASMCEGIFSQTYLSLMGPGAIFITSLVLSMGAGARELGLIFASGPIMQGAQVLGPALVARMGGGRKKAAITAAAAARACAFLIPVFALAFKPSLALPAVVAAFLLSQALTGVASNVWTSWIGAMVPERIRGRFLGKRMQLVTFFGIAVALVASLLKDLAAPGGAAGLTGFIRTATGLTNGIFGAGGDRYAYTIIFVTAALLGFAAFLPLRLQRDRPSAVRTFKFGSLAEPFKDKAFRPLLAFFGCWFFAIYFGSPFWQPFFIGELGMSLTAIQLYGMLFVIAMAATASLWGKIVDRFGNRPAFRFLILLSFVNAFVYVFMTRDNHWWLWLEAFTSAVMWGGAGVATMSLLLRLSPEKSRDTYVAAFAVVTGGCGMAATLISGYVVGLLPKYVMVGPWHLLNMKVAFLATAVLRLVAEIPLTLVREQRSTGMRHMMRVVAGDARLYLERMLRPGAGK